MNSVGWIVCCLVVLCLTIGPAATLLFAALWCLIAVPLIFLIHVFGG